MTLEVGTLVHNAAGGQIRLVKLFAVVLFLKHRLNCSSGKEIKAIDNAQIPCLLYKLITSSKGKDDFSIGFHLSTEIREAKLTIETVTGTYKFTFFKNFLIFLTTKKLLILD